MIQLKSILTMIFFVLFVVFGCQGDLANSKTVAEQELLAKRYCGNCHSYVHPTELPADIWKMDVLPHMGHRLGVYGGPQAPDSLFTKGLGRGEAIVKGIFPSKQLISDRDWESLCNFYISQSKEETPYAVVEALDTNLVLFRVEPSQYNQRPPLTTMIKILPEESSVILSDGKSNVNTLVRLNNDLKMDYEVFMKDSPVDYISQKEGAYLLTIGENIYPSDRSEGALEYIYSTDTGQPNRSNLLADKLRRPVDIEAADLNQDGLQDFVISEFGNAIGNLSVLNQRPDGSYRKEILLDRPGAVRTQVLDLDGDGWEDVVTLFSQGDEAIYFFKNSEGKLLPPVKLLQFSPLAGSTYFEFIDWNGDGKQDLLYTSGDNADLSVVVKKHHGLYIFLGDGELNFKQLYFYPMPGCYKALARDFDQDGDLDIASISFFPDYTAKQPQHFVYLEQKANGGMHPSILSDGKLGRWIAMDAGDIDQDGDIDLALASFVGFYPRGDTTNIYDAWMQTSPSMVLLRNKMNN